MFGNAVPLVRVSGIQIKIDPSWVLIAALVVWSLSTQYFPFFLPGAGLGEILVLAVFGAFGLFASIILHELGHSLVARNLGLQIKGITLFLFGGVAELGSEPRRPRDEFWIAVAGPAVSLALAVIFGALQDLSWSRPSLAMWTYLSYINWALTLFNLIPAFPMDGGRVLRAFLWARSGDMNRATAQAALTGTVFGLGLVALGLFSVFTGRGFGGFWTVLIGFFVYSSARANHARAKQMMALSGTRVADLMTRNPVCAAPGMHLDQLVYEVMIPRKLGFVPVCDGARTLGHVDGEAIKAIPRSDWPRQSVGTAMTPLAPDTVLAPDLSAQEALDRMLISGQRKFLVMDGDRLTGVLSSTDLMAFLKVRQTLDA